MLVSSLVTTGCTHREPRHRDMLGHAVCLQPSGASPTASTAAAFLFDQRRRFASERQSGPRNWQVGLFPEIAVGRRGAPLTSR